MTEFSEKQKEFIKDIFSQLKDTINEKTEEIRNELKTQINQIKEEFEEITGQFQQKIQELEKENKTLQEDNIYLERKLRKNNIIIYGIEREETNLLAYILNIFTATLEVDISTSDISDVFRITTRNSLKCPVVVEFLSYQKKTLVINNAKKLKGKNIYIAHDQCKQDRENSKLLIQHQKRARAKGLTAYIKAGKLHIANEEYTVKDLETKSTEEEDFIFITGSASISTTGKKRQQPDTDKGEEREKKRTKSIQGKEKPKEGTAERMQTRSIVTTK